MATPLNDALLPGRSARQIGRMLAIYGLTGIVAGLAAVIFKSMVEVAEEHIFAVYTGPGMLGQDRSVPFRLDWPSGMGWVLLVLPAVGGLVVGLFCARWAPEAMGGGSAQSIEAYHQNEGAVRRRVPFIKAIATSITLGSGGSGGIEGPIAQICGGLGSHIARLFDLTVPERRVLLMAGFAAGIGAVFHCPMAAAMFAAEVLYSEMDIEHEVLVPGIIASTIAYAVYGAIRGWEPIFDLPPVEFDSALKLIPFIILAVVLSGAVIGFSWFYHFVKRHLGHSAAIPLWLRPAVGGLFVGAIGLFVPAALGHNYGIVQVALDGRAGILLLLVLAAAKAWCTVFTSGSGGAAGLFAPSLVIGGAIGGAVGQLTDLLWPSLDVHPAAFVVVGMAGFFAAVEKAPLATVIMVSEVVGNYRLIVPALWVCVLTWLLTRRANIYREQVPTRMDAPSRLSDMMGAVLHRITVKEAMDPLKPIPVTVPPEMPLRDLVRRFAVTAQGVFPIVSPDSGRLLGVVDGHQLRRTVGETGMDKLLIANDFQAPAMTITPADTLYDAISRMTASGFDELVVVAPDDERRLEGILSRREVVSAYHSRMLATAPSDGSVLTRGGGVEDPDLVEAIKRGGIVSGIRATSPRVALEILIGRANLPPGVDHSVLLSQLLDRESLGSTGVGDGVALPHPHADDLGSIIEPRVVIGLLKDVVDWGAYDGKPIDTVCMLLCPSGELHLALLGQLARALTDPTLRKLLRQRAPRKQILDQFRAVKEGTSER